MSVKLTGVDTSSQALPLKPPPVWGAAELPGQEFTRLALRVCQGVRILSRNIGSSDSQPALQLRATAFLRVKSHAMKQLAVGMKGSIPLCYQNLL